MNDGQDTFIVAGTRWPVRVAALRLWCHGAPHDALADAAELTAWEEAENRFGCCAFVVAEDLDDLHVPAALFRRLAEAHETSVRRPDGTVMNHCDGIQAPVLAAMLSTFAAEALRNRAATESSID